MLFLSILLNLELLTDHQTVKNFHNRDENRGQMKIGDRPRF